MCVCVCVCAWETIEKIAIEGLFKINESKSNNSNKMPHQQNMKAGNKTRKKNPGQRLSTNERRREKRCVRERGRK